MHRFTVASVEVLLLIFSWIGSARANDFYATKTITIAVGFSAGGDYDLRARLLSRHMGRHIPGTPTIVVRNLPGAGGVVATNWLAKVAPRDGTSLLMASQNTPLIQALRTPGVEFDARQFSWIGNTTDSPNLISVWGGRGIKNIEDARIREVSIGATGVGSGSYYYPLAANLVGGTKFKIVTGYPGGSDVNLAMERGEVDGRGSNSLAAWKATRPDWLANNKLIHLVQIALSRHSELKNIPLLSDLATTVIDQQAMRLIAAETGMARSITTTQDVAGDRVELLRVAFDATIADREFLAEAEQLAFDIAPTNGENVQKIVKDIINAPTAVVERVRQILDSPGSAKN